MVDISARVLFPAGAAVVVALLTLHMIGGVQQTGHFSYAPAIFNHTYLMTPNNPLPDYIDVEKSIVIQYCST